MGAAATRPGLSCQWRPQRPMARGGQQPTLEPPFQVGPQDPPDTVALRDLPPDLQRFINAKEAQVQPTPNVEEETADHSARWKRTPPSRGKRTPSPPPSTPRRPWTPVRTPRGRRRRFRMGPDRTMSLFSYAAGGWSTRPGWAASRRRLLVQHAGTPWTPPASPRRWISPWHSAVEPPAFSPAKRAAPKQKKRGGRWMLSAASDI